MTGFNINTSLVSIATNIMMDENRIYTFVVCFHC